ncbi:alginate lyase family protein [Streptomyces clavuligerus]|uniref:Alginate_lyase domain-containing protein n=4 Tax=Streptomyces clavuligerus TaxID=1901 RepID=E2PV14_STRCL|nr:alginate lyase family protein [Streptomyces clavuligerus]ANW21145.1 alginate lyase [Streptomyces clavuligerus]AXU15768.1 alginate lyase [Streptomyces clavuligerus]EFG05761.1 Alginate_lyase domain-containing protein [Streptomyces clavuligerus]MBY6305888.1 alginate lyase family protein [Streptomyces clavuligerus]QCS08548.1 alginate lyase [Streptomyces clavuligerus]
MAGNLWGRSWGTGLTAAAAALALLLPAASAQAAGPVGGGRTTVARVDPRADGETAPAAWKARVPKTVVLEGKRLKEARKRLLRGDPELVRAARELIARADRRLGEGPWTVVDKPRPAPSGDPHDYLSQAPYWWPTKPRTPENPWGCPYVQRDGERNPEVDTGTDRPDIGRVVDSVTTLSLAWYYTGRKRYAEHAATVLRTWFVDPATRMNPHLDHAQFIPCRFTGRAIGIIDFSQMYTTVLDAVAILDTGAPGWRAADRKGLRAWNRAFLDWLRTSPFGKEEAAAANNHGVFHDLQVAALAAATGDRALARNVVREARAKRIDLQIAPDGTQPQELRRTRSWHYSTFSLVAHVRLAALGRQLGVDLWAHRGPQGQSLARAVHYLLPAATGSARWPHPELNFRRYAAADVVRAAADAGDRPSRAAVPALEPPPGGDLWPLRPAAEQLDSIAPSGTG